MQLIRAASPSPVFELGKPWAGPADIPAEHFAFLTWWFSQNYGRRGLFGAWGARPPAQVGRRCCLPADRQAWLLLCC